MHLTDGRLIISASDLTGFLECPHLTQQELAATRGEFDGPERDDPELTSCCLYFDLDITVSSSQELNIPISRITPAQPVQLASPEYRMTTSEPV